MSEAIDFKMLINESRPRVYLLWAILTGVGYTATHFYQDPKINAVWFVLSAIGLGYMYKVMPLRLQVMKRIFLSWLVPITFGILVSVIAARTELLGRELVGYLGAFWLAVSAVGFAWNGYVDPPSKWYYASAVLCLIASAGCFINDFFLEYQYVVAAIVSVWSMLNLWIFRSEA
jgi:hypothetical protein